MTFSMAGGDAVEWHGEEVAWARFAGYEVAASGKVEAKPTGASCARSPSPAPSTASVMPSRLTSLLGSWAFLI